MSSGEFDRTQKNTDAMEFDLRPVDARSALLKVLTLFAGTRILVVLVAMLSSLIVEPGRFAKSDPVRKRIDRLLLRWDCGWYHGIVQNGYYFKPVGHSSVAFFPGYPIAARSLHRMGLSSIAAGYLVSNLALLVASLLLWVHVRDCYDETIAWKSVVFLLTNPVSFFYSTLYSESFFLMCMLATFVTATRGRWMQASVWGALTALTRSPGVLMVIPMTIEFLGVSLSRPYIRRRRPWWPMIACAGPILGLGVYMTYLGFAFGNPKAFLVASSYWGRRISISTGPIRDAIRNADFYSWWFLGSLLIAAFLVYLGRKQKLRLSHQALSISLLGLYLATPTLEAIPRYLSVVFPFYIAMAHIAVRRPVLEPLMIAASGMMSSLAITLYVNGYWFT